MGLCHVKYKIVDPHLTWAHSPKPPKVGQYHSPLTPPLLVPPWAPLCDCVHLWDLMGLQAIMGTEAPVVISGTSFFLKCYFKKVLTRTRAQPESDTNSNSTRTPNKPIWHLTLKNLLIYTFKMILALYISSPTTTTIT